MRELSPRGRCRRVSISSRGLSTPSPCSAAVTCLRRFSGSSARSSARPYLFAYRTRNSSSGPREIIRSPRRENATQTSSIRSSESCGAMSRNERARAGRATLTARARLSTSCSDSSQLRHVFRCWSTLDCSGASSSPVRSASTRVSTVLHRMGDSLLFECFAQESQRAKHFPAERGLGRSDRSWRSPRRTFPP